MAGRARSCDGGAACLNTCVMNTDDLGAAEAAVTEALTALRTALTRYRKAGGQPPALLHARAAPKMRDDAFGAARVFPTREALMTALVAEGGIGAEVGVQHGHFSRFLLDTVRPGRLHLFDMSDHLLRADIRNDPRTTLHLGDSSTQLARCPDRGFDWIYIDGDHSYPGVVKDARQALHKVKPGGLLIFNDYTLWSPGEAMSYGVIPCVNALVNDGLDVAGVALSPTGYFDVALKAPA